MLQARIESLTEVWYISSKNDKIKLNITAHAQKRFSQRWPAAFPRKVLPNNADSVLAAFFNKSVRVLNLSRKENIRLRRYGKDTLFFRNGPFTFIVQNASILTVELSSRELRQFNRVSPLKIQEYADNVEEKVEQIQPSFRLVARALKKDRSQVFINFGKYSHLSIFSDVFTLKSNIEFITFIKKKLLNKVSSDLEVIEISAFSGKKGTRVPVFSQEDIYHLLINLHIEEPLPSKT